MTSPEPPISPRGVPPIRVDWLIDVAGRLAARELGALRSWSPGDPWVLTDEVDGGRWRFDAHRHTDPWTTVVEFEADLLIPADDEKPTLRAAFAFTPWWDEDGGRVLQTRVEIGPRGPVTFDPENWVVLLPQPIDVAALPVPAGVVRGAWTSGADATPAPAPGPASRGDLVGTFVDLADLGLLRPGRAIPELLLRAHPAVAKRRLLRGERLEAAPAARWLAAVRAEGAIDASWTGDRTLAEVIDGPAVAVEVVDEPAAGQCTLRTALGALTLTGPGLALTVAELPPPPAGAGPA